MTFGPRSIYAYYFDSWKRIESVPNFQTIRQISDRRRQYLDVTGARLDARTYTFANPRWKATNAAIKYSTISPISPVFYKYYLCDAMMLIKPSMVRSWATWITTWSCNRHSKFCSGCANEHSHHVQHARTYRAGCANVVINARTYAYCSLGLFLLTWINSNPSIGT